MIKEIEINFKCGDNKFQYSRIYVEGDHTSFLTDNDILDPNDPEFVNKCMHSIKPIQRLPLGRGGTLTWEREFSKDGRGMIIVTKVNGQVVAEEKESDFKKRHQKRSNPPLDHQDIFNRYSLK